MANKKNPNPVKVPHAASVAKGNKGSITGKKQIRFSENTKPILFLSIIAFIVYINTLNNNYAYDDMSAIKGNVLVTKGISAIPEIISTPYRHGFFVTSNDLYRPLSLVMFAIEYQVFNGSPVAGHFINILFYAGCIILLFLFLDAVLGRGKKTVAFIASLLFALHPIHTEVVANIKSRDELMCFFFAFLGLNIFIRYIGNGKINQLITGAICFFLSLLSKETSIAFLFLIPFIFFFYYGENKKRSIYVTAGYAVVAALFLLARFYVLHTWHADVTSDIKLIDNELSKAPSVASGLATKIFLLGSYIKILLIPYPLICDYSYNCIPFVNFSNIWVLLSLAVYLALIVLGIYRFFKFPKDPYAFGILFFLATIALFSNIPFLIGSAFAERFVFFASAGFCLVLSLLIEKWRIVQMAKGVKKATVAIAILLVSIIYTGITIARNTEWADSITLYKADIKKAPNNARLHCYIGNELIISGSQDKQIIEEAIAHLKNAIKIYPEYDDAHKILGNGYFFLSMPDSAELHLELAHKLNPADMEAVNNLGVVYFNIQKYPLAIEMNNIALEKNPKYLTGYNNNGICYLHMEKYDSAIYYLEKGIAVDPAFNPFYENLALAYKMKNLTDSALKYQKIAQISNPSFRVF
jgi:tetratricopeptide (TPR) repeat protein